MLNNIKRWAKSARDAVDSAAEAMSGPESTRDTLAREAWQHELDKLERAIDSARRQSKSASRMPVPR